jgi:hypothetical protein
LSRPRVDADGARLELAVQLYLDHSGARLALHLESRQILLRLLHAALDLLGLLHHFHQVDHGCSSAERGALLGVTVERFQLGLNPETLAFCSSSRRL